MIMKYFIYNKKYLILSILLIIYFRLRSNENVFTKKINITHKKNNGNQTIKYSDYILICERAIRLKLIKIYNNFPFISICIPLYNNEKYIEQAILSILNQSFQDFEIIIVNDFSSDNTEKIIRKIQLEDKRIKIINHNTNLGTYHCRAEGVLNSKGKYILFLDSDDMFLNVNLFEELFNYNLNNNYDIIEFLVYWKNEGENKIYYPKSHSSNHNHKYATKIIYQPELSDIIFYKPRTKIYTFIFCRTLWNKIYKREIQLKAIKYIGENYYKNPNLIMAEDTMMNVVNFFFAKNYTNINIPGYLHIRKKKSISIGYIGKQHRIRQNISFLLFFNFLYRYIKDFKKDINFIYYEIKHFRKRLFEFKTLKINNYLNVLKDLLNNIKNDENSSQKLKLLIKSIYNYIFG